MSFRDMVACKFIHDEIERHTEHIEHWQMSHATCHLTLMYSNGNKNVTEIAPNILYKKIWIYATQI